MQSDRRAVVLEITDGGGVVAIVESGEPTDDLLRRAIEEASTRTGELIVVQLIDESSALRRALAKAVLARDVAWWNRNVAGFASSIEAVADGTVDGAVAYVRDAACIVMSSSTSRSERGMAVLRRRVLEMVRT